MEIENKKWKNGELNPETGLIFKAYSKNYKNGEAWLTKEKFEYYKLKAKERVRKKYLFDEDFKKKRKKYTQSETYKAKANKIKKLKWKNNPEFREKVKRDRKVNKWYATVFLSAKSSAKIRKQEISITPEWILNKFNEQNGKCYWLNIDMIPSILPNHPQQPSLERLDINLGYTKENTVICCLFANLGRKDNSKEIMTEFIKNLKQDDNQPGF